MGARLCESWGLPAATVNSVRHHVTTHATHRLPPVSHRYVCVLSALADTLTNAPGDLDQVVGKIAPQAMMDQSSLLRAMQKVAGRFLQAPTFVAFLCGHMRHALIVKKLQIKVSNVRPLKIRLRADDKFTQRLNIQCPRRLRLVSPIARQT